MELKKSYKGFIIWLIGFCAICFGVVFLPIKDYHMIVRVINNISTIGVALLTFIVYKTEFIYWYNGISYEEALQVGKDRRKVYAWKLFRLFGLFALVFLGFSIIAQILNISSWIDIAALFIGIVAIAISTMGVKL